MNIVAPGQRAYISSHPLALWFSIGFGLVGILALLFPGSIEQTAASTTLPAWLTKVLYITFAVGGISSVFGIVRGRPDFEALGMSLFSSGLIVNFIAIASLAGLGAVSLTGAVFLVALAIGCFGRVLALTRRGYHNH